MSMNSNDELDTVTHIKQFFNQEKADQIMEKFLTPNCVQWQKFSWYPGHTLKQLVYVYDAEQRHIHRNPVLEELVNIIETKFNTKTELIWCNFFRDSKDLIEWHQDQYNMSLFVFSFGASRPVEIRPLSSKYYKQPKKITNPNNINTDSSKLNYNNNNRNNNKRLILEHGDLYYWSARFDKQHEHRVPPAKEEGQRISILILAQEVNSNSDPQLLQQNHLDPVYSGVCGGCQGFLAKANDSLLNPTRKCKSCGEKYGYSSWY
eukprot:Pgem_evm1s7713